MIGVINYTDIFVSGQYRFLVLDTLIHTHMQSNPCCKCSFIAVFMNHLKALKHCNGVI